jgi:DnaJ-class molecular chaperone
MHLVYCTTGRADDVYLVCCIGLQCRITLHEAICGFKTTVQSLDGRTLRIEAPNVTPDTIKILPGEGMPNSKVSIALLHSAAGS